MPDDPHHFERRSRLDTPPPDWRQAFAALGEETPPRDGWTQLAAALDAPHHRRRPHARDATRTPHARRRRLLWLTGAAALALALIVPGRMQAPTTSATPPLAVADQATSANKIQTGGMQGSGEATASPATMQALYLESAQLESLLAYADQPRVSSATAVALSDELHTRIAAIDAALAQPDLSPQREYVLWIARVRVLRALVSFEGTRRWLALNGERYDGVLMQVN